MPALLSIAQNPEAFGALAAMFATGTVALGAWRKARMADLSTEGLALVVMGRTVAGNRVFHDLAGRRWRDLNPGMMARLRAAQGQVVRLELERPDVGPRPVDAALRPAGWRTEVLILRDPANMLAAELSLRHAVEGERRLRLLIQSVTDYAIYMLDPSGNVANWNAGAERNKGYTAEEIVGENFSRFFSAEDRLARLPERALETALRQGKFQAEGWRYRKDGSRFWASVLVEPIHGDDGAHLGFAKITHDDTRKREDAERLAALRRNLELALGNMSQGLALFDAGGRLLIANDRLREIVGLSAPHPTQEDVAREMAHRADLGGDGIEDFLTAHRNLWSLRHEAEIVQDMRDGRTIRVVHRPVPDGGWVSTYEDISERRRSEEQIVHMARHDTLTGLPNRASFSDNIAWALDTATAEGNRVAVLGIDLDRFKEINDHLGHSVGDAVLRLAAERMAGALQSGEFVARFGGDEFAAFIEFRHDADLHGFIKRLDQAISARMLIEGNDVSVGASIGVAIFPGDAGSAEKLIANADMAMYRAKGSLSENTCFYEAEMDEVARERRTLARDLWQAIDRNELHLHYQIQKSVSTGTTTGYEVLLRWNHPQRGPVSPAEFIPLAEECGAILPIGEWVLRTACREAASWPADFRIAVNLSPVQLGNGALVEMLRDVLAETGLAPWRLELEVTESAIIADKARALHALRQIKDLGVTIAIDDFGTGYSSLDTLRAFPFDKIKLDRSFMREVETSKQAKAIIRAILALGRSLEVPVLAEGVETMAQLALLQSEGCDEAQGFLLGRPTAPELLPELFSPGKVA
ncbi:EAL domain-containing protein [Falsirhodobacter xinxiangensis]|uniref:EAL domain-containing protein n=1 Tax=Falsirhodobacter xinxiangensis TaxID=2530049 RepID=UPI0010AAD52C|nr:EAL domain-containing protein [Rhodobacter xinxiangensis]